MGTQRTSDDIKIIAQFLAGRAGTAIRWGEYKRDAFKLRQHLKQRGGLSADPATHGSRTRGASS